VIRHQAASVHNAAVPRGEFAQGVEVVTVIFGCVEAGTAVVAALDDVPGDAGKGQSCMSRHETPPLSSCS